MTPPLSREQEKVLSDLYYVNKMYLGRDRLYKYLQTHGHKDISRRQVMDWLKRQELHQLYRKAKASKDITTTVTNKPYKQIAIDLVDMSNMEYNGYKWLLTAIDLFTKKAWATAMKNKTKTTVVNAMKRILKKMEQTPASIRSDNGSEFVNDVFKKLLADNNIKQVLSLPSKPQSNGQIERFNGTIKRLIKMALKSGNTKNWVKMLQQLVDNYNNTPQDVTKKVPNKVEEKDVKDIKEKLQKNATVSKKQFEKGDKVRIKVDTEKSGQNWSNEIYTVKRTTIPRKQGRAVYYLLENKGNKHYYNNDLLHVPAVENRLTQDEEYEVSKLVKPSMQDGKAGYIVKWKGYPSSQNTWESRKNLLEDVPKMVRAYEKKNKVEWLPDRFTWSPKK